MQDKSSLNFHFHVWMDDDTELDFETRPIDVIRWEDKFNKTFAQGQGSAQLLMWIAYSAGFRQKLITDSTFDAWAKRVIDWENIREETEAEADDPTPADTPTGQSEIESSG